MRADAAVITEPTDEGVLAEVEAVLDACRAAYPALVASARFWADSAYTAAAGIPSVLLGPPGEGAHADDEWVSVSGTIACARALAEIARDFCG